MTPPMIIEAPEAPLAAVDVHYEDGAATAACVVARQWTDAAPHESRVVHIGAARPYTPGRFFERELPCIVEVLGRVTCPYGVIVVDGYVDLDASGTPGLGAHLHQHFAGRHAVVGVAKTPFRGGEFAAPILRGSSARPLFVTARGMSIERAAALVASMHGAHRIPTLLAAVDRLARRGAR
jgi:deoxyribonuclease V